MASAIPRTSRLGTRLVKSEPGPIVITSARAIACKSLRQRLRIGRNHLQLNNAALAGVDLGFTQHVRAIVHDGF